jgi:hypothetical protein
MFPLIAIAALALLALGSSKASATPSPTKPPEAPGIDNNELLDIFKKNPEFYTAMNNALMSAATNPADILAYAVGAYAQNFPKTGAYLAAQYKARVSTVTGKSGRVWDTWVNVYPSPSLSAQNIQDGWKETHVIGSGDFAGQRILVFGQKGSDMNTRKLGGVWSPLPINLPAGTVEAAKADFGV